LKARSRKYCPMMGTIISPTDDANKAPREGVEAAVSAAVVISGAQSGKWNDEAVRRERRCFVGQPNGPGPQRNQLLTVERRGEVRD
jgi:hypothetical protein